ncbi:hypothetical protein V7x_23670 [Crateriforma conspicua]|uniref:Uncharacterized protein n=1 Tax=Crateriforma conspicua TaxID=2527996 RepID=A0A5C6FWP3_9PLAN|nr:hypothetical protein V7x_23670 [Crateriforma conspicua]
MPPLGVAVCAGLSVIEYLLAALVSLQLAPRRIGRLRW